MPAPFAYTALPGRVVFGAGALARAGEEARALGARALILATPGRTDQAHAVAARLDGLPATIHAGAAMHTPVEATQAALAVLRDSGADLLIAVGGGSAIGLSKALALRTGLNQLVIPTTYAGSEMTPILGETKDGAKTTLRSMDVLPETVIYDPDLTLSLPPAMSTASGLNAIAHAVEALYSPDHNPVIGLMAEDGARALSAALPRIAENPADPDARADALYGAYLCGVCLGVAGMALHHKLCHTLGGAFGLPHAQTHAVLLPHALAYNAPGAPGALAALQRALGADDPALRLHEIGRQGGVPHGLRALGMAQADIARAADLAVQSPYGNPVPVTRAGIESLLARAWSGAVPVTAAPA